MFSRPRILACIPGPSTVAISCTPASRTLNCICRTNSSLWTVKGELVMDCPQQRMHNNLINDYTFMFICNQSKISIRYQIET